MKIVISSQGEGLDSIVDPRFGRAAHFIFYDTETSSHTAISNAQGQDAAQGAGIKAAETVSRLGARVLITGQCGPKALDTLKAAGIRVATGAEGCSVAQAVEKYQSGQLHLSNAADAAGQGQ